VGVMMVLLAKHERIGRNHWLQTRRRGRNDELLPIFEKEEDVKNICYDTISSVLNTANNSN